jgi:hypothetical protein
MEGPCENGNEYSGLIAFRKILVAARMSSSL